MLVAIGPARFPAAVVHQGKAIDWQRTPLIMAERGLSRERLDRWLAARRVEPNIYAQAAGNEAIIAMVSLGGLLLRWRLKWIFACGLGFGVLRFALCALGGKSWLLTGVTLHGCSFTLVFITAQIYLDERVDPAWRARGQALMSLMGSGVGQLIGYVGAGWWFLACGSPAGMQWPLFWTGVSAGCGAVLLYFLIAYHVVGSGYSTRGLPRCRDRR